MGRSSFQPSDDWHSYFGDVTAEQVGIAARRIGGILLIIGILHGFNIVLMPVLGRLFSMNRRLPGGAAPAGPTVASAGRSLYERAAEVERAADDG